jgi:alpha-beta hydrolase superfamily lysophospholipase
MRWPPVSPERVLLAVVTLLVAWIGSGTLAALALTRRWTSPAAEAVPAGFTGVRLRTDDGVEIGAFLGEAAEPRGAVVLVHGNGGSRSQLVEEARAIRALGYTVLPITVRAHGDSEGRRNDFGWSARRDVEAAVGFLEGSGVEQPIFVLGISLGSAAALFAAPTLGHRVAGYVLVGPYADLHLATARRTERYLPPLVGELAYGALLVGGRMVLPELDDIAPAHAAEAMPRDLPVLVLVGERDARAPLSDAQRIVAPLADASIVTFEGADHEEVGAVVSTPRGLDVVADFLAGAAAR